MRNVLILISTVLILTFFIKCTSANSPENAVEQKALFLANNIDSASLNLLREFSYGARGEDNFWLRVSGDTNLYVCNYMPLGDSTKLTIWRPHKFMQDFSTAFTFDTSVYSEFTFAAVQNDIVKIALDSSVGSVLVKDTMVKITTLFPDKDPFKTFDLLTSIAKKYDFSGSSYSSEIGDFFMFRMSADFKLFYIPDTLNMNPEFKRYWLDKFNSGKEIKPHWRLVPVSKH